MRPEEKLFDKIGEIDEKHVADALANRPKKRHILRYIAAGAAAAVVLGWVTEASINNVKFKYLPDPIPIPAATSPDATDSGTEAPTQPQAPVLVEPIIHYEEFLSIYELPENSGELPMLEISQAVGGMGFEGIGAENLDEALENAPWSEDWSITEMPVFRGKDPIDMPESLPMETLRERLYELCNRLGAEPERIREKDGTQVAPELIEQAKNEQGDDFDVTRLYSESTVTADVVEFTITVSDRNGISISIPLSQLPEACRLNAYGRDTDFATAETAAQYIAGKYYDMLGMYTPETSILRDFSIDGESHCRYISLYDSCKVNDEYADPLTAVLNCNFRKADLKFDGTGLTIHLPLTGELPEALGVYPVISKAEADEKLLTGDYTTTVWVAEYLPDGISEDKMSFSGLVYRQNTAGTWLPYYRYLVELKNCDFPDGLTEYGAFYVPAVRPEYLTEVEREVHFN